MIWRRTLATADAFAPAKGWISRDLPVIRPMIRRDELSFDVSAEASTSDWHDSRSERRRWTQLRFKKGDVERFQGIWLTASEFATYH